MIIHNGEVDGIECLALAHCAAGVDVTSDGYIKGVRDSLNAIANRI